MSCGHARSRCEDKRDARREAVIRDAVLACYARQVTLVRERLGGDEPALRRWFAAGMLDNVVAVLGLDAVDEPWAVTLRGPDRRGRPPSR